MAADNGGLARRITAEDSSAEQIRRFVRRVSGPLLTDVEVEFPEGKSGAAQTSDLLRRGGGGQIL